MTAFLCVVSFAAGFAACWFSKEHVMIFVHGAAGTIQKLEDNIRAIRAAL
jgi:hypothetical protein